MMAGLSQLLAAHELLLLFLVIVFGLVLARIKIAGVKLGLSGVLFAGLFISAWLSPPGEQLRLAPELKEFGLTLFVYCVGLSSAPGFFSAFRQNGLKLNLAIAIALAAAAGIALAGGRLLGLDEGLIAGLFCGALTNTPALGAVTDALAGSDGAHAAVLGYSICYPFGVVGALLLFRFFAQAKSGALSAERERAERASQPKIVSASCLVTQNSVDGKCIGELRIHEKLGVIVSRVSRNHEILVPNKYTALGIGDVLTLVGEEGKLEGAIDFLGEPSETKPDTNRQRVDMRRILVSKQKFAGRRLRDLAIEERFNAQVTRLRRADLDIVPTPDIVLQRGDRLRVVAPREQLPEVAKYFGDSERELAALDFVAVALGIFIGLLLGRISLPVMGAELSLGTAGGPLVAALVLGRLGRTGPISWSMPYEANTTLRELGLLVFLAGVGVSAGSQITQVMNLNGLYVLLLGATVTLSATLIALFLLRKWAKAGVIESMGVASGMQTQPATLAAAYELGGKTEMTYVAYAIVYPVGMIGKILLAQMLALAG